MTSRVATIARNDFERAVRNRLLWGTWPLVFLLMVPTFWQSLAGTNFTVREIVLNVTYDFRTYVVVIVAVVAYNAVVGERESGTVKFVLGLPSTRRDLVVGKLLSRTALVVVALVPILAVLDVVLLVRTGGLYLATFVPVAVWILLYAVAWTGFTVGLSAAFATQYRTLAAVTGTYLFYSTEVDIWGTFVRPAFAFVATGTPSTDAYVSLGSGTEPLWVAYTGRLNPVSVFAVGAESIAALVDPAATVGYPGANLFGVVVLVSFGLLPFLVGCRRFDRADLG